MLKIVGKTASLFMVGVQAILGTYYLIASPPLFFFYPQLQDLQSPSVYVPGMYSVAIEAIDMLAIDQDHTVTDGWIP
jgi:hypothetical protein